MLYLDEFEVTDIGDAMILANLLHDLFLNNVALIISSNHAPEDLYKNGLQRQRFLPAIELINTQAKVLHLESQDYRMKVLRQKQIYNYPLNQTSKDTMINAFQQLTVGMSPSETPLKINERMIATLAHTETLLWFRFEDICGNFRCAADYLEIARYYPIVLISDILFFRRWMTWRDVLLT